VDTTLIPVDAFGPGLSDASPSTLILCLLVAFVLGQAIAWTYSWAHSGLSYSRSFTQSLILITMVVAFVMGIIGNSIVTAFGLLGTLALIRFRNVLKDTRDTVFVFIALVVGMAIGTQRYLTAIVGTAVMLLVVAYLSYTSFGSGGRYDGYLTIRRTGAPGPDGVADATLRRFCRSFDPVSERRVGQDSEAEIVYRVGLRDRSREGELLASIRGLPGVTHASLMLRDELSEV
jgi:hypothetical protein